MFKKIKRFYALHLYTCDQVWEFVEGGAITEAQFTEIVGGSK